MAQLAGKTILVTGAAGFIGSSLVSELLLDGECAHVVGFDCVNDYYDVSLKRRRLERIQSEAAESPVKWTFVRGDLADGHSLPEVFGAWHPQIVVHLAAQAGVRYSVTHPEEYIHSNVSGFFAMLEMCRRHPVEHLVYASSSSVYGMNAKVPYAESDMTDAPVSLYAATKKSNELFAHSYSALYGMPLTGVRIFTAYGPWGRPDMAYFSFAEKMRKGETIELYNFGNCLRDFTYIADVVGGLKRLACHIPCSSPPHEVYNLGSSSPVSLMCFVETLCDVLKEAGALAADYELEAHLRKVPAQQGDVTQTYADVSRLCRELEFRPRTALREGLRQFARWYVSYAVQKRAL